MTEVYIQWLQTASQISSDRFFSTAGLQRIEGDVKSNLWNSSTSSLLSLSTSASESTVQAVLTQRSLVSSNWVERY